MQSQQRRKLLSNHPYKITSKDLITCGHNLSRKNWGFFLSFSLSIVVICCKMMCVHYSKNTRHKIERLKLIHHSSILKRLLLMLQLSVLFFFFDCLCFAMKSNILQKYFPVCFPHLICNCTALLTSLYLMLGQQP